MRVTVVAVGCLLTAFSLAACSSSEPAPSSASRPEASSPLSEAVLSLVPSSVDVQLTDAGSYTYAGFPAPAPMRASFAQFTDEAQGLGVSWSGAMQCSQAACQRAGEMTVDGKAVKVAAVVQSNATDEEQVQEAMEGSGRVTLTLTP